MTTLQVVWFLLIGVLLVGYAILDGFDLGAGFWHLFSKGDGERRAIMNSVGPVWDGNEVWLLTGAGAIFAAFPPVYATVFSGFYMAMMLLLLALIGRAVAFEFRSKVESPAWRKAWDVTFALGSTGAALLFGVAVGNVLRGIPLDVHGNFTGTFLGLLNPYALLTGLLGVAMVATQGGLYLVMKTEGALHDRAIGWSLKASVVYIALYLVAAVWTVTSHPHLMESYAAAPVLWVLPALALAGMVAALLLTRRGSDGKAFLASSVGIAALLGTSGAGLFPRWVPALGDLDRSLTVWTSSSSELTLKTMLVLALIGMPIVIGYTIFIYRTFRGKVVVDEHGY